MQSIDWIATAQLSVVIALCAAGIVSGIRASLRLRRLEREWSAHRALEYVRRADRHQRNVFYDPFD
ncbi:hypothetical protein [Xanthomonas sp. LMG 12461]|uniref:hypothetical protein n=1 Tax=Xanthomonas sp. LMG 12461 TaxID=2014543 RepID=UPI00126598C1|nr:hypothetical protein [Xanthomonas sp. LMG 12461]